MATAYFGSRQEQICPDCKGTDIVEDHGQGDMVCRVRARPFRTAPWWRLDCLEGGRARLQLMSQHVRAPQEGGSGTNTMPRWSQPRKLSNATIKARRAIATLLSRRAER